jgi:hypothetical protein
VESRQPPRGLPPGAPGASMASSASGGAPCCPRGTGWSGGARPTGCHPVPPCKIRDRWGRGWEKAPHRESDVWQPTDHQSAPATEDPPDLHQLVHQRLWTTMDILGLNSKIRSDHGLIRTSWWVLLPTTDQKVRGSSPFGRASSSPLLSSYDVVPLRSDRLLWKDLWSIKLSMNP